MQPGLPGGKKVVRGAGNIRITTDSDAAGRQGLKKNGATGVRIGFTSQKGIEERRTLRRKKKREEDRERKLEKNRGRRHKPPA